MQEPDGLAYEIPLVTVRYARHLIRFLEARGIGRQAVLSQGDLEEVTLHDPDAMLSMHQVKQLLTRFRDLLSDERAPFEFGQQLGLVEHGLLGFTLLKRRTQRELVNMVVQYLRVALPIMDMDITCSGDSIYIRLRDIWRLEEFRPFMAKVYMGSVHALASLVCKRFRFEFDFGTGLPLSDWQVLAESSDIRFGAGVNQVTLILSEHMPRYSDTELPLYLADMRSGVDQPAGNIMEVVMRVRQFLLNNPGRRATLEQVAEHLDISARSVRRHLRLAGLTFHELRQQIRETFATRYLNDTRVPLTRIASMLGYSDQASFTKAYRSWTGTTPGIVRRQAHQNQSRL